MATSPPNLYQVDSFTGRPFAGNPAAVCLLEAARETEWMRAMAREMNLSATAFLVRRPDGAFDLRWFTPAVELELCGHATLATAHVLAETGALPPGETARFHTRSGLLTAERQGDWIELDFPAHPAAEAPPPADLLAALGVQPVWIGRSRNDYLLVELPDEAAVRALAPDFRRLGKVDAHGIIATARSADGSQTSPHDFISRFFAPGLGIDEDSVTGSSHCTLGPYWSERLGKTELLAYQASERGGEVRVRMAGDRVRLGGRAVTILEGRLAVT